ncbi:MAG: isoprenylcysteine carboxylmethyltransferase family protein [Nitrososphaeria archaeon]
MQGNKINSKKIIAYSIILSAVFITAILYSTLQLPVIANEILKEQFVDYGLNWQEAEKFIESIKPIGYIGLITTFALIILGFISKNRKFSFLGSLTLYLPTFSYFASTMFFLAGIGILRILWLPIIEISPGATWSEKLYFAKNVLELGDVVYLPYDVIRIIVSFFGYLSNNIDLANLFDILSFYGIILLSAVILFLACTTWLYNKFSKKSIITSGLYKYSRHPQYLSFILWSYGLLLYDKYIFTPPKGGYFAPPPLLWLTTTMAIIALALREEIDMVKKYGIEYIKYRERTPFLVPLPKKLVNIIAYPTKKLFKKELPEKFIEIMVILAAYYILLIIFSLFYQL